MVKEKFQPLKIETGNSYPIKPVIISDLELKPLRKFIKNFILAMIKKIEDDKNNGLITQQENLYVVRTVGPITYSKWGVNISYRLQRITKKDWIAALVQSRQNVKKITEYTSLINFLDPFLTQDQKYYPTVLADFVVQEYFSNVLTSKRIQKIVDLFVRDLQLKPVTSHAEVELFGLQLQASNIQISKNLRIDQVKTDDLNFEKPLSLGENNNDPFPSAFFRFDGKNGSEISALIKKTIILLRLYKIGGIRSRTIKTYSDSILFRGGGTEYHGNIEIRGLDCVLSKNDCKKFPIFWKKLLKLLHFDNIHGFNDKFKFLDTSYGRYSDSLLRGSVEFRISNAVMSLESLYLHENIEEISYRLRNRIARLLTLLGFDPEDILNDVGLAYSIRSAYVHGSDLSKENKKKIQKINDSSRIAQEILLKRIQEYTRISLLSIIIFNKPKIKFVQLIERAQINDKDLTKLKNYARKIKPILKMTPIFTPYDAEL